MRISEVDYGNGRPVDAYGPGGFRIEGVWHEASLIVTPGGVEEFTPPVGEAVVARLAARATELDVVIIGQGPAFAPLEPAFRARLEAAGLGVETMATPAACRTYNLLLAEGRRVAAVLVAL